MENAVGRILKGSEVKLEGRFHLDVVQDEPSLPKQNNGASEPVARIVENHPQFAVIEISCSCGARTHLRCEYEYAGAKVSDEGSDPSSQ